MKFIQSYYNHFEEVITEIEKNKDGYNELIINYYYGGIESLHFIFENIGISIPIIELLIDKEQTKSFKFLSKEDQDNIIIGRELIELIGVDIKEKGYFIINNEKYISKIE